MVRQRGQVLVPAIALTFDTMTRSKRLSNHLDTVSDERLGAWVPCQVFFAVRQR